jgi:beta-N-acetylhexosaminidase
LRRELAFAGVVVTDDLGMDALAAIDPFAVVDRAIAAGVDLLLYATPPVDPQELIAHLRRRVDAGEVPPERIDASLRRLLRVTVGR